MCEREWRERTTVRVAFSVGSKSTQRAPQHVFVHPTSVKYLRRALEVSMILSKRTQQTQKYIRCCSRQVVLVPHLCVRDMRA